MDITATLSIMIFLMVLMLVLYLKYKKYNLIIIVYLFSLIIGVESFTIGYLPFTPWFQIFYVVFMTIIFVYTSIDYNNYKKSDDK